MLDETPEPGPKQRVRGPWSQTAIVRWLPILLIAFAALATPFVAPAAKTSAGPSDEALRSGAEVYNAACSACHQPGGAGLAGQFPPLVGNPNIDDAAYVESTIRNGLSGEIDVNGEIYDGVMPAQSTLSDEDITNVIAYIQSGFAAPAVPVTETTAGESDGGGLPTFIVIGFYVALLIGAVAFAPRIIAVNDPRTISWFDAWLKAAVIVVGLIVATTLIPARVIESDALQDVSRNARDLITVGVWAVGLTGSLFLLWYAHRKNRI